MPPFSIISGKGKLNALNYSCLSKPNAIAHAFFKILTYCLLKISSAPLVAVCWGKLKFETHNYELSEVPYALFMKGKAGAAELGYDK